MYYTPMFSAALDARKATYAADNGDDWPALMPAAVPARDPILR